MPKAILRWTIYLAAVLVVGPLAGAMTAWLRAPDGGTHATPLVSTSPVLGLAAGLGAVGVALAAGFIAVRHLGAKPAMSTAGLVLAWAAWRTGTIDQIVRQNDSAGVLWMLAAEGAIFGLAGVLMPLLIGLIERLDQDDDAPTSAAAAESVRGAFNWKSMGGPVVAGVIAGGIVAWAVAQTPLKGQAVAAAILGAVFASAAARLVDVRASLPTLAMPVAILAVLGPLSGIVMGASTNLLVAGRNGALFPLANILPLDWIAGGLLGIPLGVAWANSLIEKRAEKH